MSVERHLKCPTENVVYLLVTIVALYVRNVAMGFIMKGLMKYD